MQIEELYNHFLKSSGVCTDTRNIVRDSIFFALKGQNFNGNSFALKAIEDGCSLAVVDEDIKGPNILKVPDVLKSLQELARFHRRTLGIPVIGITGSNGKTTTKELVRNVLSQGFEVFATLGNLNNEIGVPLSLLSLNQKHQIAVIEMGAGKQGDIKELAEIAEPNYGVITSIGKAHLEGMGGPEGVVKTKSEMYDFVIENNGTILWDSSILSLKEKVKNAMKVITYGLNEIDDFQYSILESEPFLTFEWKTGKDSSKHVVNTFLMGNYNIGNAMIAVSLGNLFGLSAEQIKNGISAYVPENNRQQQVKKGSNLLILDAYNANPTSMEASLKTFSALPFNNKIVVLGEMLELGGYSDTEHQKIIEIVNELGFKNGHFVGKEFVEHATMKFHFWNNASELIAFFKENKPKNATILFKGSRKNRLETIAESL